MVSMRVVNVVISLLVEAVLRDVERDVDALAAAYPVGLHRLDAFGPVDDAGEVQQFVGVVGDAEEPLVHLAADDDVAGALALAVDDLLVGEHGLAGGAPVDGGRSAVGEALLVHLEEEPLVPGVVVRLAGDDLPVPVVDRAHRAELVAHAVDVPHRPDGRVDAAVDRGVLRRKTERVEPHGVEDVVAAHAHEAGVGVGWGHGVPVADVEVAGGVGVHGEGVPPGAGVVVVHLVEVVVGPPLLPLAVYLARVVAERGHALAGRHASLQGSGTVRYQFNRKRSGVWRIVMLSGAGGGVERSLGERLHGTGCLLRDS